MRKLLGIQHCDGPTDQSLPIMGLEIVGLQSGGIQIASLLIIGL